MKKTILLAMAAVSLSMSAQICVNEKGQLVAGSLTVASFPSLPLNSVSPNSTGLITLDCEGTVYLNRGTVKTGGKLTIQAKNVEFGAGFTVEKGGILEIESK